MQLLAFQEGLCSEELVMVLQTQNCAFLKTQAVLVGKCEFKKLDLKGLRLDVNFKFITFIGHCT